MPTFLHRMRPPGPVAVLAAAGAVLVPWSAILARSLPATYTARHWSPAWAGLDLAMAGGALITARLYRRRDRRTALAGAATGTAALVDLWFDVLTAAPGADLAQALACGIVEAAFAGYCWAVAVRACGWAVDAQPAQAGAVSGSVTPAQNRRTVSGSMSVV